MFEKFVGNTLKNYFENKALQKFINKKLLFKSLKSFQNFISICVFFIGINMLWIT